MREDVQGKYAAIRAYKSHIEGVKKDRALESFYMVPWTHKLLQ